MDGEADRLSGFRPYGMTKIPVATVPSPPAPIEAALVADAGVLAATTDRIVAKRVLVGLEKDRMAALPNRLTEKLGKAAGVLQRRYEATEKRADALIAREEALAKREEESFSPHEQAAALLEKQYDLVERNYDILENANPLDGSEKMSIGSGDVGKIEGVIAPKS